MDQGTPCLLEIDPPDPGLGQQPVLDEMIDSEACWSEYELRRSFASEAEARAFAAEHGINDVSL